MRYYEIKYTFDNDELKEIWEGDEIDDIVERVNQLVQPLGWDVLSEQSTGFHHLVELHCEGDE